MLWVAGLCVTLSTQADLASLFTNLNATRPPGRPRLPSIVFIQCDSLGYLDLSCYGQTNFATPNLDHLASLGLLFTNYDACGASRGDSRAAFLTGRNPASAASALAAGNPTIAQVLKTHGYHTGLIGEWDFGGSGTGNTPWEKGFDEFAGYFTPEDAENYYADFMWRYAPNTVLNTNTRKFETYVGREPLMANLGGAHGVYIPDLYTKAAQNFIHNNSPDAANHYRPFFLWLSYPTPRPNQNEARHTGNGLQVPSDAPYSDEPWPAAERNKAAMIARLDADIGTLISAIGKLRESNNVAVFFTSAAVPQKTGGLDPRFFPSVVSTNDVRLPLLAWWPQHFPAGRVSAYHCTPADFLPTAAELGFIDSLTNLDGTSLLPVLYGQTLTNQPTAN